MEKDVIGIDKHNLDVELVKQPKLYGRYAKELVLAEDSLARAEAAESVAEAEAEIRVRRKAKRENHKITESEVKKRTILDQEVRDAAELVLRRKKKVGLLKGMLRTLEHRKTGIEKLCDLDARDYFSRVRVNGKEEVESRAAFARGKKRKPI